MIEWVWPWMFALAPLPVLVRLFIAPVEKAQAALTVPDLTSFKYDEIGQSGRQGNRIPWRTLLLWLIWLALVVAMARPQWTGEPVTLPTSGRDLMLAVDISGSMGTEDLQLGGQLVNRLTVVKNVVSQFIDAREAYRLGAIERVVPREALLDNAREIAAKIAQKSPAMVRLAKEALSGVEDGDLEDKYRWEQGFTFEAYTMDDSQEARDAFVDKRDASFADQ